MKDMIIRYKFKGAGDLKKDLADCLAELFRNEDEKNFDWIIPVPDDPGRKREYRPIQIIARRLSRQLEIPVMKNNLIKVRKTEPQVGLSQAKRLRNLDGAFRIKNPGILKKQTVLLIDDVYTTGTTVKKCSVQLEKAGARVVAMTLARSI
jgi:ComF family protein